MPTFDPYEGLPAADTAVSGPTGPLVPGPVWFVPSPLTVDNTWQGAQTFTGPVAFDGTVTGAGGSGGVGGQQAHYVISKVGANFVARNGATGANDYTNVDITLLAQAVITGLGTAGGVVYFTAQAYTWGQSGASVVPAIPPGIGGWGATPSGRLVLQADPDATFQLTAQCPRLFNFGKVADYDTFQNIVIDGFVVDGGGWAGVGALVGFYHYLIGTKIPGSGSTMNRVNFRNIVVRNCQSYNVPIDPTNNTVLEAIGFDVYALLNADVNPTGGAFPFGGQPITCRDMLVENCDFVGGNSGVNFFGGSYQSGNVAPVFYDQIHIHRCRHRMVNPNGNICQRGDTLTATLDTVQTTVAFAGLADYPATDGTRLWVLTIHGAVGSVATDEKVQVTSHATNSTSATVVRGYGGTSAIAHAVGEWVDVPAWGGNFQAGSNSTGGFLHIADCQAVGSGDIAFETDSWDYALLENLIAEDSQGSGFYWTNYHVPRNPAEQRVVYRNCHSRKIQAKKSNYGFAVDSPLGYAIGETVWDNCDYFRSAAGFCASVTGEAWHVNAPMGPISLLNCRAITSGGLVAAPFATAVNLLYLGSQSLGGPSKITIRNMALSVSATNTPATNAAVAYNVVEIHGGLTSSTVTVLDVDGLAVDFNLVNWTDSGLVQGYSVEGLYLSTGWIKGRISGLRVAKAAGSTGTVNGLYVNAVASVTIPTQISVFDADLAGAANPFVLHDNISNVIVAGPGAVPTVATAPVNTPVVQPGTIPWLWDKTNHHPWFYDGGSWVSSGSTDALAVHLAGAEVVTGVKTFTQTNFFTASQQLQIGDASSQANGPELHFIGTNGAWGGPAIDIAAAIPARDFVLAFKYPVTWTALDGACASGSTAFSSASAAFVGGTNNGQRIQGNGIQADTFVTVVDATHLTLSKPTTGVVSGYYSLGAPGGAIDFVYLSHGGTHAPTFGIGKAQPDLTYRAVVMGPADGVLDTAMGGFRVVNGNACTGDAFHVENWGGGTLFSVSSGGATLVTVPIALAHALQVISGASTTMLNLDTTGSGAFIVPVQVSGFGLGSTGTPTATIDAVSTTTNNATLKVRTASWGSFQITANGTTPGDVTLGTANGTALKLQSNAATRITLTPAGSVVIGTAALANATTDGFLYIPTVAGAPTGVPTAQTGTVPLAYDVTNDMLYIYRGGWKKTTVFA